MKTLLSYFLTLYVVLGFFIGCQHPAKKTDVHSMFLEGKVYVVGNEPFIELALQTGEGKVYTLRGGLVSELKGLQGQWVRITGEVIASQHFLYSFEGFLVEEYEQTSREDRNDK
ncbi:MAG: hypothetical protein V2A69_03730 [Pseudomonadota bacterium]